MTISPSMAGAARISAIFWILKRIIPDAKVIKLEQNYRSTANILDAANQVIAHNAGRKDKALWTRAGSRASASASIEAGDEREEAAWVCQPDSRADGVRARTARQFAVLYRTNAQSRVHGRSVWCRQAFPTGCTADSSSMTARRSRTWWRICACWSIRHDDVSVRRIINVPKRAIGDTHRCGVGKARRSKRKCRLLTACMDMPESISFPRPQERGEIQRTDDEFDDDG